MLHDERSLEHSHLFSSPCTASLWSYLMALICSVVRSSWTRWSGPRASMPALKLFSSNEHSRTLPVLSVDGNTPDTGPVL